jgi:hypothetical protein
MLFPNQFSLINVDGEDVVGYASDDRDLFWTAAGFHVTDDKRHEQVVHLTRLVIKFHFPEQRCLANRGWGEDVFILLPVGALRIDTVGEPIGSANEGTAKSQNEEETNSNRQFESSA